MTGIFCVLINGVVHTYNKYEDIPHSFDNLIRFEPEYPPEPHTDEQHHIIAQYNSKLRELMGRERNASGN